MFQRCEREPGSYSLALFREGKHRYMLVYAVMAMQQVTVFREYRKQLLGAWQVDFCFEQWHWFKAVLTCDNGSASQVSWHWGSEECCTPVNF